MQTDELDYALPKELIAQQPTPRRTGSRLLLLPRTAGKLEHRHFADIVDYLCPGDCLVLNESKVIPARFFTRRGTGGQIEGLFLQLDHLGNWQVLLKNASRLNLEETITLCQHEYPADGPALKVIAKQGQGQWLLEPQFQEDYLAVLHQFGSPPLPPYIRRTPEQTDRQRYHTVYAKTPGSVAAPTAGLHFTEQLLQNLQNHGINIARLTLHVGLGTFQPITAEDLNAHTMHAERYHLDHANAAAINAALERGSRVIAVGTTCVRALESLAVSGRVHAAQGSTKLFITAPYRFEIVKALITNFHLPRTTLLALVCAFGGTERVLAAYREAIALRYRFYSYGDAMLML